MAMKTIELEENQKSGSYALSQDQLDALRQIKSLTVERVDGPNREYHLTPGSVVGAVEVDGLSVRIRPKIGVRQLLSLACYAADQVTLQPRDFDFHQEEALPDFLALALNSAARRAFSRGLLHGYVTQEEAMYAVRGRIRFAEQMRRRFSMPMPVEVRHDDYTDDITANRLVKAAATTLGTMRLRSSEARNGLVRIAATLDNVSLVEFPPGNVPKVKFDRLNAHYKDVVALSTMVLQHNAHQLERGAARAPGVLVDMIKLFQEFVTVALRQELGVSEERFRESQVNTLDVPVNGDRGRVDLKPDLVWWDGARCVFVGDAKYKSIDKGPVPSDLYQMLAYVTALDLPGGLLIYADGEAEAKYTVRHSGKLLEVAALDLSGTLDCVLHRVRALAARVRKLRAAA